MCFTRGRGWLYLCVFEVLLRSVDVLWVAFFCFATEADEPSSCCPRKAGTVYLEASGDRCCLLFCVSTSCVGRRKGARRGVLFSRYATKTRQNTKTTCALPLYCLLPPTTTPRGRKRKGCTCRAFKYELFVAAPWLPLLLIVSDLSMGRVVGVHVSGGWGVVVALPKFIPIGILRFNQVALGYRVLLLG